MLDLVRPIQLVEFDTWKSFKGDLFERIAKVQAASPTAPADHRPKFLFRGQACADWPLWTSFDRMIEDRKVTSTNIEKIYHAALEVFYQHGMEANVFSRLARLGTTSAFNHVKQDPHLLAELEAFAQHYGFPTRLLDWSESPYVAAFFAACEPEKCVSKVIAIWCLDVVEAKHVTNDHDLVVQDRELDGDRRQVWQRASFTINRTNLTRTNEVFDPTKGKLRADARLPVLFKCTIPVSESEAMLEDLDFMRINYLSVYPDVEGLVKHSKYKTRVIVDNAIPLTPARSVSGIATPVGKRSRR